MDRSNGDSEVKPMLWEKFSNPQFGRDHVSRRRRLIIAILIIASFITYSIFTSKDNYSITDQNPKLTFAEIPVLSVTEEQRDCGRRNKVANMTVWNKAVERASYLIEDKFTVVLHTYRRPDELNKTITHLTEKKIPSLFEIVIIWNDINVEPPADYITEFHIPVRFRRSKQNSLNNKLIPDPDFRTQGLLLSDDDWNYKPSDLEYVFQLWWQTGMHRLMGPFARGYRRSKNGDYIYDLSNKNNPKYQIVLSSLLFAHISFLDYYSSATPLMESIRKKVDDLFNCEDIALQFVASMLTCEGPLQVLGLKKLDSQKAPYGISTRPGHVDKRSQCMNDFVNMFSYMPLQDVETHIKMGVVSMG